MPLWAADFEKGLQAYEKGDFGTALEEWRPLAEKGAPHAQYNLGLLYAKGQGTQQDFHQAAQWYEKAAQQGVVEAEYNLGVLYSSGSGVPKDYSAAAKWFQKAAEQGDVNAANNLGTLYDGAEGGPKNPAEAEKWYRKAAEEGSDDAMFNLGVMYDIGQGVKVDFAEAEKWYRKAAERWNDGALCNLAILYYNGDGVKRDLVQSHQFYLLAQEAGDPRASNLIKLTTEKLTPKQIAKAKEMAEQFKQSHKAQIEAARTPVGGPSSVESKEGAMVSTVASGPIARPDQPTTTAAAVAVTRPAVAPPAAPNPSAGTPRANAQVQHPSEAVWTGVERVVALGDRHGNYHQFTNLLRSAKLIDQGDNWIGGNAHLVQTGDLIDEGPESRQVMDLMAKLEKQAELAGGHVHCLIGNHEAMEVYGDLRFVTPGTFSLFRTADSEKLRDRYYDQYQQEAEKIRLQKGAAASEEMPKAQWSSLHPLGFFEEREAFAPDGEYGKWIRSHNTVIRINDTLYTHAGLTPKYAAYSLEEINKRVRAELVDPMSLHGGIVTDQQGPLWYQGFSRGLDEKVGQDLDVVLAKFSAARVVVGHVEGNTAVTPRFNNRVLVIDVAGNDSCCFFAEGDKLYTLYRGSKLILPSNGDADMLRYLKQAAALDASPSPLDQQIRTLETHLGTKH